MPRGPRVIPDNGVFHITIRGNNKRCIFKRPCEFRYFKKLIKRYKGKYNIKLYHYALMKNHVHLCLKVGGWVDISKMMQGLQLAYNHYHRKRYDYVGHLWQGRFKSVIIKDDQQLLTAALYIEKNAVEAGLVNDPIDYPWSSYRYYAIGEKDDLVDADPLYNCFGNKLEERQSRYMALMISRLKESAGNNKMHRMEA